MTRTAAPSPIAIPSPAFESQMMSVKRIFQHLFFAVRPDVLNLSSFRFPAKSCEIFHLVLVQLQLGSRQIQEAIHFGSLAPARFSVLGRKLIDLRLVGCHGALRFLQPSLNFLGAALNAGGCCSASRTAVANARSISLSPRWRALLRLHVLLPWWAFAQASVLSITCSGPPWYPLAFLLCATHRFWPKYQPALSFGTVHSQSQPAIQLGQTSQPCGWISSCVSRPRILQNQCRGWLSSILIEKFEHRSQISATFLYSGIKSHVVSRCGNDYIRLWTAKAATFIVCGDAALHFLEHSSQWLTKQESMTGKLSRRPGHVRFCSNA